MSWFLIESDSVQPAWVEADTELGAKRIHATRYGDEQRLSVVERRDAITLSVELEGNEPPFRALEEDEDGRVTITEKRVNQAGSKGLYKSVYDPNV